ncbi:hypothetical protein [Brevibacterium litoralis]|uniref:hypothetical protein n=1 Tax=Brevibacterium litoralis TaxID=3138935 RepID=UPI0032F042B1
MTLDTSIPGIRLIAEGSFRAGYGLGYDEGRRCGLLDGFRVGYDRGHAAGAAFVTAGEDEFAALVADRLAVRLHNDEEITAIVNGAPARKAARVARERGFTPRTTEQEAA